jgi:transposase-like protein
LEDGDIDFLQEGLKVLTEAVMDAEVTQLTGAERFERSTERENYRDSVIRLVETILQEQHDEWSISRCHVSILE